MREPCFGVAHSAFKQSASQPIDSIFTMTYSADLPIAAPNRRVCDSAFQSNERHAPGTMRDTKGTHRRRRVCAVVADSQRPAGYSSGLGFCPNSVCRLKTSSWKTRQCAGEQRADDRGSRSEAAAGLVDSGDKYVPATVTDAVEASVWKTRFAVCRQVTGDRLFDPQETFDL